MELRVVTHPEFVEREAEHINAMLKDGLQAIHIRKPKWTYDQIMGLLEEIDEFYHEHVIVHQLHDMAKQFGMSGVHLKSTERDQMDEESLDQWLNEWQERGCKVSTAIHNMEEFESLFDRFQMLIASPVFESLMKPGYRPEIDWLRLLKGKDLSKVVAVGGISLETVPLLRDMNFAACGALGAIWKDGDPLENYKKLKTVCEGIHSS